MRKTSGRRWPRLRPALVADLLAGHSGVGLALGAAIYLVCLTGTLCVPIDALRLWEAPRPAPSALSLDDLDSLVTQGRALEGNGGAAAGFYLLAPTNPRQRPTVYVAGQLFAPNAHGRLTRLATPWSEFLMDLHIDLTAPRPWGGILVGVLGMGLFSLLVSGVLAHPRILRDAFVLRLNGGRHLQEADLHNRLGVWGLPFHLAVTASGALFGLGNLLVLVVAAVGFHGDTARVYRPVSGPPAAIDPSPAPIPPLAPLVRRAVHLIPSSRLYAIGLERPGTRGERISVEVQPSGRLPRGEQVFFDRTGTLVGRTRFASGALGLQIYSAAVQVHFGAFGGLPLQLAYTALGLALTVVCAGGMNIWLARRRDRGRPAPRLERAWDAWVWGAPTALAVAALPVPSPAQNLRTEVFWATAGVIVLAAQIGPVSLLCARTAPFRRLCGAALLLVVAARTLSEPMGATGLVVSTVIALAGLALVLRRSTGDLPGRSEAL